MAEDSEVVRSIIENSLRKGGYRVISASNGEEAVALFNEHEEDIRLAQEGLAFAREAMNYKKCDLLILDEINVAVEWGLVTVDEVLKLMRSKPADMELVLTGRYASEEFMERADLVTEMKELKHPFRKGTLARKGIEH